MANILLVSWVTELLENRKKVLRTAGHQLAVAGSVAEAQTHAHKTSFDLVIFGRCVPEQERNQIAAALKKSRPHTRIIMPYLDSVEKVELADVLIRADATPQDLLRAVTHLLGSESATRRTEAKSA